LKSLPIITPERAPANKVSPGFHYPSFCAALDPHTNGVVNPKETKEAHQMPPPRRLAALAVPVMAGAVLVAGAATANADAADDAYVAQLRTLGFNWSPDHDAALTGMGRLICDDLVSGWTYEQIAQQIHATLDPRNIGLGDVRSMVGIAHATYCPAWRCWTAQC
jgi:hypothetical protein